MDLRDNNNDLAGPDLTARMPFAVRNQVNDITSFLDAERGSSWRRHVELHGCYRRNGLRFTCHSDDEEAFYHSIFAGLPEHLKEIFFLQCYVEMRSRNLWPVNIAAEQRLCDERWAPYTGCPNTPAAIQ
jgi:hypothetical protein